MSYPLLNVFWTIFEVFLWITWFWILITVFIDIFRSQDLSGAAKAVWFLFVLLIPLIGVVVYLIVRGGEMHERTAQVVQARETAYDSYPVQSGTPSSTADQLAKLRYTLATAGNLPVEPNAPAGVPANWIDLFKASAAKYCAGLSWTVLAAIGEIESGDGANEGPSSAGAEGPMQFLPSTWAIWGTDGFGRPGPPDIWNP